MYTFIVFQMDNQGENPHSLDASTPFIPWVIVCWFCFYWKEKAVRTVEIIWDLLKEAASNQPVIYCLRLFPSSTSAV